MLELGTRIRRRVGGDGSQTRADRRGLLAQLSAPLREYLGTEAGGAGVLLGAAVLALVWANSPWSGSYESLWSTSLSITLDHATMSMTLQGWVNEGLMVLFFFVIGLEVRRELAVGELTERRRVVVPALAGVAGTVVPALLFLAVNHGGASGHAWGVVVGTDTAFLLGALALVGPEFSTQLRIFLLTLTVIDDLVAVTVIGVVYSGDIHVGPLLMMLACLAALAGCSRAGVWRAAPYVLLMVVTWFSAVESGVHPSIAGMVGGLLVAAHPPAREEVEGAVSRFRAFRQSPLAEVGRSAREGVARVISVNERLQSVLHPWTSFVIVPLFAVANAGVDLRHGVLRDSLTSALTWGVVLALVVGKTIGIWGTAIGAVRLRWGSLPQGVGPGHVLGGAALSGIGFTVSLLIAGLAFDDPTLRDEATVGVLIAAVLATGNGRLQFWLAARLRGEGDADLPRFLDRPVVEGVDFIRGPVDAPLTLVEYGDFECPFCAKATGAARELRVRFGDELRYVFRHLPLPDVHPHAELAACASVAAAAQGRFWEMHDLLFQHQDQLELEDLVGYAGELGLDVEAFLRSLEDPATHRRVRADVASAEASGARGTPTFFIGDRRHVGPYDAETLARELLAAADRVGS
jgi:Na+/H+ antiporter NhaA